MNEKASKLGRKEILTEELAKKIAKMVSTFPDLKVAVNWENVMAHSKSKFGHTFNRQMLSQKEWKGRKLIAEAFSEAKAIQRRQKNDSLPKYKTAPRAILQRRIRDLEEINLALKEELEKTRAKQVDQLDAFLNSKTDLRTMVTRYFEEIS